MNLTEILELQGVIIKEGKVEASSFAINVIGSKSDKLYINKLPTDKKVKLDGKYWISLNYSKELMENSKMKKAKGILNKLNEKQIIKTESIITQTKQILDNKIDIENCNINYQGKDINIIVTEKNEVYYKGVDVAEILEYINCNQAIVDNVNEKYIKSYQEIKNIWKCNQKGKKVNSQTKYISLYGLIQLILKSKKKEAVKFQEWVIEEVIPSIIKTGSYSNSRLEHKSFYDDALISTYEGKRVFYIAYIGCYGDEHLYKYGISRNIFNRDVNQHRKTFDYFQILQIYETDNYDIVEELFEKEMKVRGWHREMEINNKRQTELFSCSDIEKIKEYITIIIRENPINNEPNNFLIRRLELEVESKRLDLAKIEAETRRLQLEIELIKLRNNKKPEIKELEDKSIEYFFENNIKNGESTEFIYATELYEKYNNTSIPLELFVKEIKKIKPDIIYKGKTKDGIVRKAFFGIKFNS
jgi:prophage antirepressor-like protein